MRYSIHRWRQEKNLDINHEDQGGPRCGIEDGRLWVNDLHNATREQLEDLRAMLALLLEETK